MTNSKRRWLIPLSFAIVVGACGVSDLDVEGRDPGAGGNAGKSSTPSEGGEGLATILMRPRFTPRA